MAQTPTGASGSTSTPKAGIPLSLALPSQPAATSAGTASAPNTTSYFTATPSYPPTAHQYYQYATAAGATPYRTAAQTPAYPAYPSTPMTAGTPGAAGAAGAAASAYYPYSQAFNAAMYSGYLNSPALGGAAGTTTYPYGPIQTPTTTSAAAAAAAVPSPQVNQAARITASLALPGTATTPAVPATPAPVTAAASTAVPASATQPASTAAATTGAKGPGRKQTTFKGAFVKDLRNMMYGFGDDPNPAPDTVNVMEEILMEYIADVCATSLKTSRKHTIKLEDLRRALSRPADSKKLARMEELLFMQEDIKRARAQFDPADESVAKEMAGGEAGEEEEKPGKGKEKLRS
ncbi:hypothetical protein FS837_009449 [Tulasnella sp. UAMH 9824]|nr:hypothetical protein FS837_009449 [Tulasnella sp. UAMH 9824]